jgi:hypothetical protein
MNFSLFCLPGNLRKEFLYYQGKNPWGRVRLRKKCLRDEFLKFDEKNSIIILIAEMLEYGDGIPE